MLFFIRIQIYQGKINRLFFKYGVLAVRVNIDHVSTFDMSG